MTSSPLPDLNIDIHALLAWRHQVAVIWSIEDVRSVRDDLTGDQAWEVLKACRHSHDCNQGLTWDFIEWVAEQLFPIDLDPKGVSHE